MPPLPALAPLRRPRFRELSQNLYSSAELQTERCNLLHQRVKACRDAQEQSPPFGLTPQITDDDPVLLSDPGQPTQRLPACQLPAKYSRQVSSPSLSRSYQDESTVWRSC